MTTDTEHRQMLYDALASPEADAEIRMFERSSRYLQSQASDLMRTHPDKFALAYGEQLVAVCDSIEAIRDQRIKLDLPAHGWAVLHLSLTRPQHHVHGVRR